MSMDLLMQRAMELLIAKLPPETLQQVGQLARTGVELSGKLDRIEATQAAERSEILELRNLFVAFLQSAQTGAQPDDHRNSRKQIRGPHSDAERPADAGATGLPDSQR